MATSANVQSSRVSDIQIITSLQIDENNGAETNANAETPASGLFIVPSTVAGRAADVTGFLVTSENEYGKLQFSDPDGFLSLTELSDVTITTPVANQVLLYNGTTWVNGTTPAGGAAGADTQVQFNNAGVLDGDATLTWTTGTATLTITGTLSTVNAVLGLAPTDTIGFYGETPVVQQTDAIAAAAFVANTSGIVDDTATFGGYTVGQVVAALQVYGILA